MSLKNFIFSKLFLKNLGIAAAILIGGLIVLLLWLNIYTRHGQAKPVPNFYGLTLEEAAKVAKKAKMTITVLDSVYSSAVDKGCVLEQNPVVGFKVKNNRNISLIINAFNTETVTMPNLVDLPLRQAIVLIENSGLTPGLLRYKPDLSINVVLNQQYNGSDIEPNVSIPKGSAIDLVLGRGLSSQRTMVPNLIGLHLPIARDKIISASLNLGTYIYDNTIMTSQDSVDAFIYMQSPSIEEEETLQLGSSIYLWLTTDSLKLAPAIDESLDSLDIPVPSEDVFI